MQLLKLFSSFLLLLIASIAQAQTLHGKVVNIADGDTLTILTSSKEQVKIRLAGIDTPEKAQPFGTKAKQYLAALAFQKYASIDVETIDRYGRTVATVFVGGQNINAEMVRSGMAWVYTKYSNDKNLLALEAAARQARRGLWLSDKPIAPWLWRKGKRTVEHNPGVIKGVIIGNRNSKVYHLSNCPSYNLVYEKNRVLFTDEALAKANGYQKAGNCP